MEFQYKAMKPNGDIIEGIFVADQKQDVIEMLKSKNNYPMLVEEKKVVGTKEITLRQGIGPKDLAFFCRQLEAMLRAGSTITKSLDIMKRQITSKVLRNAVVEMHAEVQKGKQLSETMKPYPKIFPELMIYMTESGELSGTLDVVLERLAVYFDKNAKMRSKIRSAMVYPALLFVMSNAVVVFMSVFIMPTFVRMFEGSGVELPGLTRVMLDVSKVIKTRWYIILLVLAILALAIYQYVNSENGRLLWDRLKLNVPVLRGLNRKLMTARFTRNLSTMLASGVPLLTALNNLANIIGNKVVSRQILDYRQQIQQGKEFHEVVRESRFFPPMLDGMIEIGKESGTLDDVLAQTAEYYEGEVDVALQRMVALFEPLMIIVMAFIVGFIVVSMALPMFDMFQTIN